MQSNIGAGQGSLWTAPLLPWPLMPSRITSYVALEKAFLSA